MNIVFISHSDFHANSGIHIFNIARQLAGLGNDCLVCVPWAPWSVYSLGIPGFRVASYAKAWRHDIGFADKRGPDFIHAWTPRERVRKLTQQLSFHYRCPYVVHLEDNEEVLFENALPDGAGITDACNRIDSRYIRDRGIHPLLYKDFIAGAAGMTALILPLLSFKPANIPGLVFWPGFDDAFLNLPARSDRLMKRLGITGKDMVLVYTGAVHDSNFQEVKDLYEAVSLLQDKGLSVKLVKTGNCDLGAERKAALPRKNIIDLGFVKRKNLPEIVALAHILVQPGGPGAFNDYRFPSKIPEYLVSGRPVILPRTNIGLHIRDGQEGLLLDSGDAADIAEKIEILVKDKDLRERIGEGGRQFAIRHLQWQAAGRTLRDFYNSLEVPSQGEDRLPAHPEEGKPPPPVLTVIIISFNTAGLLRTCLKSVSEAGIQLPVQVIVVDNASTDVSTGMVESEFPEVELIKNSVNVGFAAANNQAFRLARGKYLLLLNSDAVLKGGCIETLTRFMEAHPEAAAAGPRILNMDGTLQNKGFCFPSIAGSLLFLSGVAKIASSAWLQRLFPRLYWSENETTEVDFLHGSCMMVRKDMLYSTGGFSEDYFMYFEEQDWCFRARRDGYQIWYVPSAEAFHLGAASPLSNRSAVFNNSMVLFYRKDIGTVRGAVITALQILSTSISLARAYFRPRHEGDLESVSSYLSGQVNLLRCLLGFGKTGS